MFKVQGLLSLLDPSGWMLLEISKRRESRTPKHGVTCQNIRTPFQKQTIHAWRPKMLGLIL